MAKVCSINNKSINTSLLGIWKRSNVIIPCDKYDGEYENDKKCGLGLFTWATGNYY